MVSHGLRIKTNESIFAYPICLFPGQVTWCCIKLGVSGADPYFVMLFEEEYFGPLKDTFSRAESFTFEKEEGTIRTLS